MRQLVSYQRTNNNFLLPEDRHITYHSVITDVSPANWLREHNTNYAIIYTERISEALASELVYGGAGIPAEYYAEEE